MADPIDTPRKELRHLISERIRIESGGDIERHDQIADMVMGLFTSVSDDWDSHDVSTLGEGRGANLIWSRALAIRIEGRPAVAAKRVVDGG